MLTKHYGGVVGHDLWRPTGTVTAKDHHSLATTTRPPATLEEVDFTGEDRGPSPTTLAITALVDHLAEAKRVLADAPVNGGSSPRLSPEAERLRWFPTPTEVGV